MPPSHDAFLAGFDGYELPLPNGTVIHCEPLTLRTAARFMRLMRRAEEGDSAALLEVLDTFPAAVGAEEEFLEAELTVGEFCDAVRTFMSLRRPTKTGRPTEEKAPETERKTTTSLPDSTT